MFILDLLFAFKKLSCGNLFTFPKRIPIWAKKLGLSVLILLVQHKIRRKKTDEATFIERCLCCKQQKTNHVQPDTAVKPEIILPAGTTNESSLVSMWSRDPNDKQMFLCFNVEILRTYLALTIGDLTWHHDGSRGLFLAC